MFNSMPTQENKAIIIIRKLEKIFVIFTLFFFSEGLFPIIEVVNKNKIWQHFFRTIPPIIILLGTVTLLIIHHQKVIFVIKQEKLLWLLIFLAIISVFWSVAPIDSLRRLLVLVTSTSFGLYFCARYKFQEKLQLLGLTLSIITILSLIFILFLPSYGIMGLGANLVSEGQELEHQGLWRGIFQHKNTLGRISVLTILTLCFNIKLKSYNLWILMAILAIAVGLLIKSGSRTALLIFAFLLLFDLLVYFFYKQDINLLTKRNILVFFSAVFLLFFFFIVTFNLEVVSSSSLLLKLNKISSGRIEFWQILWGKIRENLWFGYGFGGFWLVSPQSRELRLQLGDWAAHSHNGFIDLMVDLGLVGLLLFTVIFLRSSFLAGIYWEKTRNIVFLWFVNYSILLLLLNLTESVVLTAQASLYWILYVDIVLSISCYHKFKNKQ